MSTFRALQLKSQCIPSTVSPREQSLPSSEARAALGQQGFLEDLDVSREQTASQGRGSENSLAPSLAAKRPGQIPHVILGKLQLLSPLCTR